MTKLRFRSLVSPSWAKVGQCTKCMRQSAIVCIGGWLVTIFVARFGPAEAAYTLGVFAMLATVLSVVHIATYAQRKVAILSARGKLN